MAVAGISANRLELLQIADAVAREKTIDRKIVIQAMEEAIESAAKARYGAENDIRCEIDPKNGDTKLMRVETVVDLVENDNTQISLEQARKRKADVTIGDTFVEHLPPLDFGQIRIALRQFRRAGVDAFFERHRRAEKLAGLGQVALGGGHRT